MSIRSFRPRRRWTRVRIFARRRGFGAWRWRVAIADFADALGQYLLDGMIAREMFCRQIGKSVTSMYADALACLIAADRALHPVARARRRRGAKRARR